MSDPEDVRHSWNRSQSDSGFRPIKQVGYATSIGFPLMIVGHVHVRDRLLRPARPCSGCSPAGLLVGGLLFAASSRIG